MRCHSLYGYPVGRVREWVYLVESEGKPWNEGRLRACWALDLRSLPQNALLATTYGGFKGK
jgi:hypothetical protein